MNAALKHSIITAGLMIASTTAFAETFKAKIDFPFRAGSTTYAPGQYDIDVSSLRAAAPVVTMRNVDTKSSGMLMSLPRDTYAKPGDSKLVFQCHQETGCALARIQADFGSAWDFPVRKSSPAERERVAVVTVPLQMAHAGN
jgi:hypothetical protein